MLTDRGPSAACGHLSSVIAAFALASLVISGCGDTSYVTGAGEAPGDLVLSPAEATVVNRDVVSFQALVRRPDGSLVPPSGPVGWSVSNDSVARITEPGRVEALLPGVVQIVAHGVGASASANLTVFPRLQDLSLSLEAATVEGLAGQDDPVTLAARVVDVRNQPVPGVEVSFESEGPVGSISPSSGFTDHEGWFRAEWVPGERAGSFEIRVSTPGLTEGQLTSNGSDTPQARIVRSIQASVRPGQMADIVVVPEQETLSVGESRALEARVFDRFGNEVEGGALAWTSSAPDVASVDSSGRVEGRAVGEATIEVVAGPGGSLSATATIKVQPAGSPQAPLSIRSGQGQSTEVGAALARPFEAQVRDEAGNPVSGVTVSWLLVHGSGTLEPEVSVTDAQGIARSVLVVGTSAGPRKVSASASGMEPVMFEALAMPGPVETVLISPSKPFVKPGDAVQLAATVLDAYSNVVTGQTVTWSSNNVDVASVTSAGRVQGHAKGTVQISASVGGAVSSVPVEVDDSAPEGGGNGDDGDDNGGNGDDGGNGSNGGSSPPGKVTDLKVAAQGPDSLVVAFTEVTDGAGGAARYEVRYHVSPIGSKWDQATVVGSGTCRVPVVGQSVGAERRCSIRGLSASTDYDVQLVAFREETGGAKSNGQLSNIASGRTNDPPTILGALTVSPGSLSFSGTGGTRQLEATAKNSLGAILTGVTVQWSTSNPSVATVNSTGLVTAKGTGSAVIVASASCCTSDSVPVTVTQSAPASGPIPAFPGAEGWGATALNASRRLPLRVHIVTSTAASGSGTLSEALNNTSSDHYDVIVFRRGGVYERPSPEGFRINTSHVYIAGQTAPGGGVMIAGGNGATVWLRGPGPNISDIVLRHMRIRGASTSINISKGDRIILDHLSITGSSNHHLSILRYSSSWSQPISNVSVQNSILGEALAGHPTAFNIGAQDPYRADPVISLSNLSIHRNLFAHNSHRNPLSAADNGVIANNVLYNWNQGTIQLRWRGLADVVNNYGKEGPMTLAGSSQSYRYLVNPHCSEDDVQFSIYAAGNVGPMSSDPAGDNWNGSTRQVACYYRTGGESSARPPSAWRRNTPQAAGPFPVMLRTATQALSTVVANAGASRRLTCEGRWVSGRDAIDASLMNEVTSGTGPSSPIGSSGGIPSYSRGTPCVDTDGDGLPDAWEIRYFGCATCADPGAVGRNGYLVIEHYLNGTAPN